MPIALEGGVAPGAPGAGGGVRARLWGYARSLSRWAGVDHAIAFSVAGRAWSLVASPVTLLLVGTHLTSREQGFYYAFSNILGLGVLFELGLSSVVGLIASHERAHVTFAEDGGLGGSKEALDRLGSLLRGSALWYGAVAVLIVALILPGGLVFFSRDAGGLVDDVVWRGPWLWVAVATALACLLTPTWSFLSGLGCIIETARVRLVQQIVGSALFWMTLLLGWRLFATPVVTTFAVLYGVIWLRRRRWPLLAGLWTRTQGGASVNWASEVWPLQWRIALSWLGAWYMFQTLAPLMLFRFQGAVLAGQMGMSLTISQALSPMGAAWIATKMPTMGTMVARKEYAALDRLFFRALRQSTGLMVLGGVAVVGAVGMLNVLDHPFSARLLPVEAVALLAGAATANHVAMAFALYLRSHKQEPLVWLSGLMGTATAAAVFGFARHSSAFAMCGAYFLLTAGANTFATWRVFQRKRREWHA